MLISCAERHSLDEVPVEGGTVEQRAAVRAELERFEQWIGADRVQLSGIEFRAMKQLDGSYNRGNDQILLSDKLHSGELSTVFRHELCHALDRQEGLLKHDVDVFTEAVSWIEGEGEHPLNGRLWKTSRDHRAEVFAYVCQQAPLGTALLSRPCSGDPGEYAGVATWVADNAWAGSPDVRLDSSWSYQAIVGPLAVPPEVAVLMAIGSESHDAFQYYAFGAEPAAMGFVYGADGAEGPIFEDLTVDGIMAGYDATMPFGATKLTPFGLNRANSIDAVSDGELNVRLIRGLNAASLGFRFAPRVLVGSADGAWSVVEGACPAAASSVFLANGNFYSIWAEDSSLWWSQVQ